MITDDILIREKHLVQERIAQEVNFDMERLAKANADFVEKLEETYGIKVSYATPEKQTDSSLS